MAKDTQAPRPGDERDSVKRNQPKTQAAGIPAIITAVTHMGRYMQPGEALRTSLQLNQKGGIDCPGCAWPDPDGDRSPIAEYCENGIKAIAEEAQKKRIGAEFFAQHSVAELRTWSEFELGKAGRLAEPLVIRPGDTHYRPISWDDAFELMGQELQSLDHPDEAVFYTSGRASNEAAYLLQLFAREYGTNNLPDCSNMCHESTSVGLSRTIGIGKGTVTLQDLHEAELIVIIGQNPGTNHPRMLTALEKCKENGGKIIAINPLREAGLLDFSNPQRPLKLVGKGTTLSDLLLPVKVGGDIALLKAIMLLLWHQERTNPGSAFDWDFITNKTTGYEDFITDLKQQDFNQLSEACGIERQLIKSAVEMISRSERIIICWAMGITQHENGTSNVQEIVNLTLLRGALGKPGAGLCPVRGHSNVQGDRTVGVWHKLKPALGESLKAVFDIDAPSHEGLAAVDTIKAMAEGKVKFYLSLGGNLLNAISDTDQATAAMPHCRMSALISTKLNRNHLIHGHTALILPCLGRTEVDVQAEGEQFVTTENSTGVVQMSKGILPPVSPLLLSEPAIISRLAEASLGARAKVDWAAMRTDYDNIRAAIDHTIEGFERYNERVREPGGFYLPNAARHGRFETESGRAVFTVNPVPAYDLAPGEFALTTIRSHDQFNTTIYGLNDRYRGVKRSRHIVFMHREDMRAASLVPEQRINIVNHGGGVRRVAANFQVVPYDIPRGCLAAYFPEANVLIPLDSYDPESKCPSSKRVVVTIEPC